MEYRYQGGRVALASSLSMHLVIFSSKASLAAAVVLVAACSTPVPTLSLTWAGPATDVNGADPSTGAQACPAASCEGVPLECASVVSIRVLDPATGKLYIDQCEDLQVNGKRDMCAIGGIDLRPVSLPVAKLEVQVAVFSPSETSVGADGARTCPQIQYSASGFPVEAAPTPALGGRAFYHPGDAVVEVTLGCTDLSALNRSCAANAVPADAIVEDFRNGMPLTGVDPTPDSLNVSIGEPQGSVGTVVLTSNKLQPLSARGAALWHSDAIGLAFDRYACTVVLENVAQSTSAVTCTVLSTPLEALALRGTYLPRDLLETITKALRMSAFPSEGLTVGIVVDSFGDPLPGVVVNADLDGKAYAVQYLAGDHFEDSRTDASGIFVSTTAPFGTSFDTMAGPGQVSFHGLGGLIANRATMVVLRPPAGRTNTSTTTIGAGAP